MNSLISINRAATILETTPAQVIRLCRSGALPSGEIEGVMVIPETAVRGLGKRSDDPLPVPTPVGSRT